MTTKLYHRQADGTLSLITPNQPTGENRIPNYVWDLWLPLLGGDGIAVYSLYCRLKRNGKVKGISMKAIAKACKIGTKKLNQINADLSFCGFISVSKPEGKARLMHWTTEIDIHPAPTEVLPTHLEYFAPQDYTIIAEWLVADSDDDAENLRKSQMTPPKEPSKSPEGTNQPLARQSDDTSKIESFYLNLVEVESLGVEELEVEVVDVEKDDGDREAFAQKFYQICNHDPKLSLHRQKCDPLINELWQAGYKLPDLGSVDLYITYDWTKPDIYPTQIVEIIRVAVLRYGNGIAVENTGQSNVKNENYPSLEEIAAFRKSLKHEPLVSNPAPDGQAKSAARIEQSPVQVESQLAVV